MNVYPVNTIPGAILSSPHKAEYSNLANVYHRYLKHRCWFVNPGTVIVSGEWPNSVDMDSFIIADTNAENLNLKLFNGSGETVLDSSIKPEEINIFELDKVKRIKQFTISILGPREIYLGYLFAGGKVVLPWFVVNPKFETEFRGDAGRTEGGQAYGILLPTLDGISVAYQWITQEEMETIKNYAQSVQNVIPHVIDPYPLAHESVKPMYATLSSGPARVKRNESYFYWDTELSWQEAR